MLQINLSSVNLVIIHSLDYQLSSVIFTRIEKYISQNSFQQVTIHTFSKVFCHTCIMYVYEITLGNCQSREYMITSSNELKFIRIWNFLHLFLHLFPPPLPPPLVGGQSFQEIVYLFLLSDWNYARQLEYSSGGHSFSYVVEINTLQ